MTAYKEGEWDSLIDTRSVHIMAGDIEMESMRRPRLVNVLLRLKIRGKDVGPNGSETSQKVKWKQRLSTGSDIHVNW